MFGVGDLKKRAKCIVLYKNNLLFQVFMYLHQFALYANNIWNWEFENYYFIC